jgi:hypothetical protein
MEFTVRSGMSGKVLLTTNANNIQVLLNDVMRQLPHNSAVRVMQGDTILDPLSPDMHLRAQEDVNVITDGTPLRTMTSIRKNPGDDHERPLKYRRLIQKSPNYVLRRPRGMLTRLHNLSDLYVCADCLLVAHPAFTVLDDWYFHDSLTHGIFTSALCKSCQFNHEDEKLEGHCGRCELPIWNECCQHPNVLHQIDDELWCADCSERYSGRFTGA